MQRELSISYERLGDVTAQLNELSKSLEYYDRSLAIARWLAQANPDDDLSQRYLSVGFEKVGDIALRQDRTLVARDYYLKSLAITKRLAASHSKNIDAQRNLIASYYKLGTLEKLRFEHSAALSWYQKGIAVCKQTGQPDLFVKELGILNQRIMTCRNAERAVVDLDFALKQPAAEVPGLLNIRVQYWTKKRRSGRAGRHGKRLFQTRRER